MDVGVSGGDKNAGSKLYKFGKVCFLCVNLLN